MTCRQVSFPWTLLRNAGAKRRADFGPKSLGKRGARYEIGAVVQKEFNQCRLPSQQDVGKRNRRELGAIFQKKLHKFEMPFRNRV